MTNQAVRRKAKRSAGSTKRGKQIPIELRFLISQTCGLVVLVETISNRPHNTDWLRHWYFEQRREQAKLDEKICAKYSKFLDESGDEYVASDVSGRRMTLSQRILCLTVECETLNHLLNRLNTILAPEDYDVVAETYGHFHSFYQSRIWQPRLESLSAQLEEFRLGAEECKMTQKLEQVQDFMKTKWLAKTPFDIILIPLPDVKPSSSHAESIGKTQIVELALDHTFAEHAGTVFHELCHALWGRRKDLARVCQQFEKFNAGTAYTELDEGLATALGQGWFSQSTFPDSHREDAWYNDDVVEAYSHGLYPVVTEYLSEGRRFDSAFVEQASRIFVEKCWFANRRINNTVAVLFSMDAAEGDILKLQEAMFEVMPRIRNISWTHLSTEDFSEHKTSPYGALRRIVILSAENINSLKAQGLTEEQIEFLRQRHEDGICLQLNGSEIIFCFGKDWETQQAVFLELLKKEQWPSFVESNQV